VLLAQALGLVVVDPELGCFSASTSATRLSEAWVWSALVFIDGTRRLSQLSLKCARSPLSTTQPVLARCTSSDW